jgi:hypothetical protein
MVVAAFTTSWANWPVFMMHLVIASNYLMLKK